MQNLPPELQGLIAHTVCPQNCMLRWATACRLAATCKLWHGIVAAMPIFTSASDLGNTPFLSYERDGWFLFQGLASLPENFVPMMAQPQHFALAVKRSGLQPVWLLLVNQVHAPAALCAYTWAKMIIFEFKLDNRDVMTYIRCPPGFNSATENVRLGLLSKDVAQFRTQEQARAALLLHRPAHRTFFRTCPHAAQKIRYKSCTVLYNCGLGRYFKESAYKKIDILVACSTESKGTLPMFGNQTRYIYTPELEFQVRPQDLNHELQACQFEIKVEARQMAGFSFKTPMGRFEHCAPMQQRRTWWQIEAADGSSGSSDGSPSMRQMQRERCEQRFRDQLADEERGSDAEFDSSRDLLPAHKKKKQKFDFERMLAESDSD